MGKAAGMLLALPSILSDPITHNCNTKEQLISCNMDTCDSSAGKCVGMANR